VRQADTQLRTLTNTLSAQLMLAPTLFGMDRGDELADERDRNAEERDDAAEASDRAQDALDRLADDRDAIDLVAFFWKRRRASSIGRPWMTP
jgi:hypothetical protein